MKTLAASSKDQLNQISDRNHAEEIQKLKVIHEVRCIVYRNSSLTICKILGASFIAYRENKG
jgi:hypothetical protein